ncbi:MBL fold metallo-hydrolase [Cytobacillus spongiae]|uniref:MBL fold metallo-hydrolase n=1 Tax=Cytobacillus spongiae TaxID=2901381 RepID=UPI001F1C9425|nr:MBL fold metallo-hydrolase [Cytobacillus spongiae]UII54371.1 MBL fold metallo-hydrolase [Cytobacillus spongiae]
MEYSTEKVYEFHEHRIAKDVYGFRTALVNVVFVTGCGEQGDDWVLVDAGVPFSGGYILQSAKRLFGEKSKPRAIVLTHGHFDHVGGIQRILKEWDVPVYAHKEELPYLTGKKNYLPPDPTVGRGIMTILSPLYPRKAINLGNQIHDLPPNGEIPEMPEWRWIHTPGHTPGHISLFREEDKMLLAGDAITTVKQESLHAVLYQTKEIHGPPAYFTPDWDNAELSIQKLASLQPRIVYSGHGKPMAGGELHEGLVKLTKNADEYVIPKHGKYVH